MQDFIIIGFIFLVLGSVGGFVFAKIKWKTKFDYTDQKLQLVNESVKQTELKLSEEKQIKNQYYNENHQLKYQLQTLQEKLDTQKNEVEQLQEKFTHQFEALAEKILDKKSEKFTTLNQKNIHQILDPLKEKILHFEKKIEDTNVNFSKGHAVLGEELKKLHEQNLRLSEEANNLTKALKGDNKTQGNWGELILEKVLEKSGLRKGHEYEVQPQYKNTDHKKLIPDVLVHLPEGKSMIIDAKVNLVDFEKYINATDSVEKDKHLKAHIKSIERQVKLLEDKDYATVSGSSTPDFVLMFVPNEAALYVAQQENPDFYFAAFQKQILMVGPTTLLATLRTVDMIWTNEKQHLNAMQIAKHAGSLYDKFVNLIEELNQVGNKISSTQKTYDVAMKKLTGQQNLIKDVEKLKTLGVHTQKKIPNNYLNKETDEI